MAGHQLKQTSSDDDRPKVGVRTEAVDQEAIGLIVVIENQEPLSAIGVG